MGKIILRNANYTVEYDSEEIQLLRKEFLLFEFLYKNRGQTFSRDALLDAVWPLEAPSDRTVDDHIYRLRKKIKTLEILCNYRHGERIRLSVNFT